MTSSNKAWVWYDPEADFLEVTFNRAECEVVDTADERVQVSLDDDGNIIGFSILGVSKMQKSKATPFEVDLNSRRASRKVKG